ncbi:hypothetical protein P3T76_007044 [Phytophthora citrophthora]|uniref:Uncharacterized protein n=1 Tax=Phytophthora citrophthora TaxID=4793 RepID=A0AAD9GN59_9STRA|nr:hypothetical protein P3T76_007044 [Phytophthora citrophthora]
MESLVFDVVDNDELLAEALVILDSIDVDRLGTDTPESTHVDLTMPDESAAAADLLNTAIEAVHTAFPDKEKRPVKLAQKAGKEEEPVLLGQRHSNQKLPRDPLFVLTTTESTEYTSPRRPSSGGGRTRMREQLIQLRSVVQKMEAHLETLRSPRSPRFEDCREYVDEEAAQTQEGCKEMSDEAAAWRNIAMQQFRARRKAEQQNSELRESLAAQLELSKQVETLLQAQPPHPVSSFPFI